MPVLTFSSFLGFQNRKFGGGAVAQFARKLLFCEAGDTGLYQELESCRPPHFLGLILGAMPGGSDVLLLLVGAMWFELILTASGELTPETE